VFAVLDSGGPDSSLLPLFIFAAEVVVVTLCTVRTIFVARGLKYLAPVLGFFEVSMWLFAIGAVMKNLSDPTCSLAFAGGFTLGTYLGILVEQKLAIGSVLVRTVTAKDPAGLVAQLRAANYGVTCFDGDGASGRVRLLFTVVPRKGLGEVVALLKAFDPKVFYSIDSLQSAAAGVVPRDARRRWALLPAPSRAPGRTRLAGAGKG
jgi:uncharacterized protein YebE (UPF0316 family)